MSTEENQQMAAAVAGAEGEENQMDTTEVECEDDRKLFVGGLPQDVKDSDLKTHFAAFGEIEGVSLKLDPGTGRSRGFAFIVYKSAEGIESACKVEEHTIKNKKVAVKKAQAKQGKVYVGKLKPELTDEEIREFFAQYGTIANLEQPVDKTKNERKNFCFITYEKEDHARKLLKEGSVVIKGVELEVKKVTPKPAGGGMGGGFGGRGGRGGAAGNWGNYGWPGGYTDFYGWGYGGPTDYYGAGWGGWGPFAPGASAYGGGGKTPRGGRGAGPAIRGRGIPRGQRSKPY